MTPSDIKVLDLTKRMMKMSTRSGVTVAQAASAHFNCVASLALESVEGDPEKAAVVLQRSMEDLMTRLRDPAISIIKAIKDGKIVTPGAAAND